MKLFALLAFGDPLGKVLHEFLEDALGACDEDVDAAVGFAAGADEIADATEDEAAGVVAGGNVGDGSRFPIACYCSIGGFEVGDVFDLQVAVGGYEQAALYVVWIAVAEPGKIDGGAIGVDGGNTVAHHFDDVVHDGAFDEDDGAFGDGASEAATGAEVDKQGGRPAIYDVLGRGGGGDFAPTIMKEDDWLLLLPHGNFGGKPLP